MMNRTRFDEMFERVSRKIAERISRRSFISNIGTKIAAGAILMPLLPVDRRGRISRAEAAGGFDRSGWKPQDTDVQSCDYWRHCSIDGYICDCCGGSLTDCPPGTKLSPSSWVASCYNPGDGQSYLIAYRDCCGKDTCRSCGCLTTEGELPIYRPEFSNDVVWCFGAEGDAMTYHCTISPIVGKAS